MCVCGLVGGGWLVGGWAQNYEPHFIKVAEKCLGVGVGAPTPYTGAKCPRPRVRVRVRASVGVGVPKRK